MRKAALVLSFMAGLIAVAGFVALANQHRLGGNLRCGNSPDPFTDNLPLLGFGAFILLLAVLARQRPRLGGWLLIASGALMLVTFVALVLWEANTSFLVPLPLSLFLIPAGVLHVKAASDRESPG